MKEHQSSYRQIMKATSIFGGVQFINIIIQIIRSKAIAILLGPGGMGIMGLLTATTGFIGNLTNFGLGTSAVKEIAAALGTNSPSRIATVINVIRKMVWITGLLGLLTTLLLSPLLSQITFGNSEYTLAFAWISITLLFNQLSSGQLVLLQGLRKLKYLAKANLFGSFMGLFVTLPMYYFWGINGIVPGIIGASLLSMILSWFYSRKIEVESIKLTNNQIYSEGKNMLKLGFIINLSLLFSVAAAYLVRIFISHTGGIEQVGLYNSGFTIINTYVSLIFNAMGTDYFPRLASIAEDNKKCNQTVNQQIEIGMLIMAPILLILIVFIDWAILILYSKQFIPVREMIYLAALGMFFKAPSWAIAFIFLAKGESKIFFKTELISNFLLVILNSVGYYLGGFSGLGLSFLVYYLFYLLLVFWISKVKYDFRFGSNFKIIFLTHFSLALLGFVIVKLLHAKYVFILGIPAIIISAGYSLHELNKRIDFKNLLKPNSQSN